MHDLTFEEACGVLISPCVLHATNSEPMYETFLGDVLVPGDVYLIGALFNGVVMSYVPTL